CGPRRGGGSRWPSRWTPRCCARCAARGPPCSRPRRWSWRRRRRSSSRRCCSPARSAGWSRAARPGRRWQARPSGCSSRSPSERRAHRGATRVVAEMRDATLRHVARLGPRWLEAHRAEVATLVTRGLDALEPYLVRYLPQLLQTALLTPAILVVIATQDLLSAA